MKHASKNGALQGKQGIAKQKHTFLMKILNQLGVIRVNASTILLAELSVVKHSVSFLSSATRMIKDTVSANRIAAGKRSKKKDE
jgi:hypothetical protein